MKKIFTLFFMASMALSALAQLEDGFYRIKNVSSERYITMYDPYVLVNKGTGTVNLKALQTVSSWNKVRSHMGSVWYIKKKSGNQYDLYCQHSSLGANSSGFYPSLVQINGSYQIYGSYDGFTKYLNDADNADDEDGNGYINVTGTKRLNWSFIPIGGDNFVGIEPEVSVDGAYWATFVSGFPFKLGSGMKAYYINSVNDTGFAMKELGSEVPAKLPVLIRLKGSSASDNKITLLTSTSAKAPSDNKMYGTWYSSLLGGKHENWNVEYESNNRILGKANGHLAFVKASSSKLVGDKYIDHNRGYLAVSAAGADNIIEATSDITNSIQSIEQTETEKGLYTLTGQRIPKGTTPRPGIYIKDGKKIVIK